MREEQRESLKQQQDEDEAALERERLGGPADYDEAGGTGLSVGSSDDPKGTAGAGARPERSSGSRDGGDSSGGSSGHSSDDSARGSAEGGRGKD